jgi:hypothetical protein
MKREREIFDGGTKVMGVAGWRNHERHDISTDAWSSFRSYSSITSRAVRRISSSERGRAIGLAAVLHIPISTSSKISFLWYFEVRTRKECRRGREER